MAHTTVLGFDFGMKRIGVAVGQTITCSANPLMTLAAKQGKPDWRAITELIDTWRPDALVVGLPFNMDGSSQFITRVAAHFADQLKKRYPLRVYQMDERLTTVAARAAVFDMGGYKALQAGQIDSVAAKLILEAWLKQACTEQSPDGAVE